MAKLNENQVAVDTILRKSMMDGTGDNIRDRLADLFGALLIDGEAFSSKRPIGDSDWKGDLAAALIYHGIIAGNVDLERDYNGKEYIDLVTDIDEKALDKQLRRIAVEIFKFPEERLNNG